MHVDQWRICSRTNRILHSWWKRRVAAPISDIDNVVKHVYREHNHEADHCANIGAQGRRNIDIYRKDVSTTWESDMWLEGRKFQKNDGKSGCGIVIKGVDRHKRVTIRKIAVP